MIEKALRLREAGHVNRCHVNRIVGNYDVAQHCYGMATLLYVLHPSPTKALYTAILLHDAHERYTGDVPSPVKRLNCGLHERFLEVAELVEVKLGIDTSLTLLTDEERQWLRTLDNLEFFLFCTDQVYGYSNAHMKRCLQTAEDWFKDNYSEMPTPCQEFVNNFEWRRTNEQI